MTSTEETVQTTGAPDEAAAAAHSPEAHAMGRVMYVADHWKEHARNTVSTGDPVQDEINGRAKAGAAWDADTLMLRPRYLRLAEEVIAYQNTESE